MISGSFALFRSLIIYSVCVPLALILGYLISTPEDFTSFTVVGIVLLLLILPLLLRWHHAWLIAAWNMSVVLFFLPGRPLLWLALTWVSLLIAVVQYILDRKQKFLYVPEVATPLILFFILTLVTAKLRGGFGLHAFGSDIYGAKRYVIILTSILGFFALTSQRIPPHRVPFYIILYFASAATILVGELAVIVSPTFYFLFMIFPVGSAGLTVMADPMVKPGFDLRLGGLASTGSALSFMMLCRYGIQQMVSFRHIVRLAVWAGLVIVAMYGGYRSILLLVLLTFAVLFYLEGLFRSKLFPLLLLITIVGGAVLVSMVDRLPMVVQRSMSFLPLPVDPMVRASAQASTEWRVRMWQHVLPEIPEYLWLGKGYSISAREFTLAGLSSTGEGASQGAELAGDYHNGPLSVIIPFGIPGVILFLWFLYAGFKVLRQNYLYGDPNFRRVNTFLLAHFVAKIIFFFGVFGGLYGDLAGFIGLLGLSVSINGGVAAKPVVEPVRPVLNRFRIVPPRARPVGA